MFYSLSGIVKETGQNNLVLDVQGIGFFINCTVYTLSSIQRGDNTTLYVSESIGDSNFDLYGFSEIREKRFFELLLSVSGVGPKMAISILSILSPDQMVLAIVNEDTKALTNAPGVGKKIAQRIVLELRDRLTAELPSIPVTVSEVSNVKSAVNNKNITDAIAALNVLGYSNNELKPILNGGNWDGMSADQIIKEVLKQMI